MYLHERNDSLFFVSRDGLYFTLFFRYSLNVGDTLTYNNYTSSKYIVKRKVDTIISGQTLKKWTLNTICTGCCGGRIDFVEKMGALTDVISLGYYCVTDRYYYSLNCFLSGNIKIGSGTCTYTSTNDISEKIKLNIYPNPSQNFLTIETDHAFASYQIFDFTGKIILKGVYNQSVVINISTLSAGIYLLQLTDKENNSALKKITVSR